MSNVHRNRLRGFSLIELVIVVVIIGIIGAIAIPRISRGSEGAADAKLQGDLAVLRNAIDLYATEHGGRYPSDDPTTFVKQMTEYTDADGNTSSEKKNEFIYGPYIRKIPKLSVGTHKGKDNIVKADGNTPGSASGGWFYDSRTGEIRANLPNNDTDASSVPYNTY